MKYSIILLATIAAGAAQAQTIDSIGIVGHGFSKHFAERNWPVAGADWQERNYGAGLRSEWTGVPIPFVKRVGLQAGAYRNSLSSNAFPARRWEWAYYGTVDFDLLDYRVGKASFHFGPVVGSAFGYRTAPWVPVAGIRGAACHAIAGPVSACIIGMAHWSPGKSKGNVNVSLGLNWRLQ